MATSEPCQAFLSGDAYDASVKALVKASQTHAQMTKQVGTKEVLADISNLALSEKQKKMTQLIQSKRAMTSCLASMRRVTAMMSLR